MRRLTLVGKPTPTPPVTLTITPADIESARARFRKGAPREMWGLLEAPKVAKPSTPKKPKPPR